LKRYTLSLFDMTQSEMNSKWQGAEWTLAERYSDCLKNVFFTLFYCVPLPSLFALAVLTFLNTYLVDKYSLYRLWKRKPANGEAIGKISRHFLTFAVFSHIVMAIFFFSNWPKRSICETAGEQPEVVFRSDYRSALLCLLTLLSLLRLILSPLLTLRSLLSLYLLTPSLSLPTLSCLSVIFVLQMILDMPSFKSTSLASMWPC
jgi:hypothetical protein